MEGSNDTESTQDCRVPETLFELQLLRLARGAEIRVP